MYVAELAFRVIKDTSLGQAEQAIRHYLEQLIFQGQILGREWPTCWQQEQFVSRVLLPGPDALHMQYHSHCGKQALRALNDAGLGMPKLAVLGEDLLSNHTDPCEQPAAFILYSRFAVNNSPLYCAEHFAPFPLYKLAAANGFEALIRWQLQYQALDEVQMQQHSVLQKPAERALQQLGSQLNRQGRRLARQLSLQSEKPVYYALYRGSSTDCTHESQRLCPQCGGHWLRNDPWHDLFDFCCQRCHLLSNIAWQCQ